MAPTYAVNSFWADKAYYDDAERRYYENLAKGGTATVDKSGCSGGQCGAPALSKKLDAVQQLCKELEKRVAALELKCQTCAPAAAPSPAQKKAEPAKPPAKADDDDDVDLFGSDSEEEDETAKKVKEQRLAEYAAKKSNKPTLIAKSSIVLDVKPWDDETDMAALEKEVRKIEMDGLLWGASKLVPLAYGIKKLVISTVVEDDKVSVDLLTEKIEELSDLVQSVDIASFNKI